jgi:hypothetical protein
MVGNPETIYVEFFRGTGTSPVGSRPALIEQTVRMALDHGYHVILEGIMHAARYRRMLMSLRDGHCGRTLSSIWTCP